MAKAFSSSNKAHLWQTSQAGHVEEKCAKKGEGSNMVELVLLLRMYTRTYMFYITEHESGWFFNFFSYNLNESQVIYPL